MPSAPHFSVDLSINRYMITLSFKNHREKMCPAILFCFGERLAEHEILNISNKKTAEVAWRRFYIIFDK